MYLEKNNMMGNKDIIYLASLLAGIRRTFFLTCNKEEFDKKSAMEKWIHDILLKFNMILDSNLLNILCEANDLAFGKSLHEADIFKSEPEQLKELSLHSILENIGCERKSNNWFLPTIPLSLNDDYFPKKEKKNVNLSSLWVELFDELQSIETDSIHTFNESVLAILYRYITNIAYDQEADNDISLYDQIKFRSALALSLYEYDKQEQANSCNPFILIGADFSGIQKYIYQIISKNAGKNLKGRSYYLKLISDSIVRFIIRKLDIYRGNIVYNSGGGFFIIAPNTKQIVGNLADSISQIEKNLYEKHATTLFVAIDYVTVNKETLLHLNGSNLGDTWKLLYDKRDRKKRCRFHNLLADNFNLFFSPSQKGALAHRDAITGEEIIGKEYKLEDTPSNNNNETSNQIQYLSESSYEQIQLGRVLRETDYMLITEKQLSLSNHSFHIEPLSLGFHYYFLSDSQLKESINNQNLEMGKNTLIAINDLQLFKAQSWSRKMGITVDLSFYGGNDYPKNERNEILTFDKLAEGNELNRLGVLRMDVDNLGMIFQKGIPPQDITLPKMAALSRYFDYFFSGYLNTIWKKIAPNKTFIIYSGGDDLFIIGRWDKTIELAQQIREDFKAFCCQNKSISISGGIAIISNKYPIMRGAADSAIQEDCAKEHQIQENGHNLSKNAISFFEMPLNWEYEFPAVLALKRQIVEARKKDILPSSFISKILRHWENAQIQNHKITAMKTYWMLSYDLIRFNKRYKTQFEKENLHFTEQLLKDVYNGQHMKTLNEMPIVTDYHPLELWAFAARWAELDKRTN